jgi:hypothetical protein
LLSHHLKKETKQKTIIFVSLRDINKEMVTYAFALNIFFIFSQLKK